MEISCKTCIHKKVCDLWRKQECQSAENFFEDECELYITEQRWVPVTERLPNEDVPVFVHLFGNSQYIAWIDCDGDWQTEEFTIDPDYLPKAWMPLPEPYHPKEEQK